MRIIKRLTGSKKSKVLLLIISSVCGISMIAASQFLYSKDSDSFYSKDFTTYLENKVENILYSATGSDTIDVMITFKETESQSVKNTDTSVFSYSSGKETKSNTISEIAGVMIVCKGITSQKDFNTLKCAVATVLGISQNKIYIIGGEETQ